MFKWRLKVFSGSTYYVPGGAGISISHSSEESKEHYVHVWSWDYYDGKWYTVYIHDGYTVSGNRYWAGGKEAKWIYKQRQLCVPREFEHSLKNASSGWKEAF